MEGNSWNNCAEGHWQYLEKTQRRLCWVAEDAKFYFFERKSEQFSYY